MEGLQSPWPLEVGAQVELDYYASRTSGFGTYPTHWAIVRLADEADPVIVASATDGAMPQIDGSLSIAVIDDTMCETEVGSCGFGTFGRVAIGVGVVGLGGVVVFDHGEGGIGDYAIHVAEAVKDTGNCDGDTMNWYEVVVVRVAERLRPAIAWRRGVNWGRDTERAVRRLVRAPLVTLSLTATLTVGLGAFAVVYAVVDKVLLAPLPFDRLHALNMPQRLFAG